MKKPIAILLVFLAALVSVSCGHGPVSRSATEEAQLQMLALGFSPDFTAIVGSETRLSVVERDDVVRLNLLGFLVRGDYTRHYSADAVAKCRAFLRAKGSVLRTIERRYGVPKEAITALLWVETKHGRHVGSFLVTSVFYYLLQAPDEELVNKNVEAALAIDPALDRAEVKAKIMMRAKDKAAWAVQELKALEEIYKKRPEWVLQLKGSFAGAFGISQFIPSSYLKWARAHHEKPRRQERAVDLFSADDAIASVGNYLKENGWTRSDAKAQRAAILKYNKSEGYADVILKLAKALRTRATKRF